MIEDGDEIVRVHAETDVLRNVNAEATRNSNAEYS